MHNIHELEKRWLTYKIKSYIPIIIILLASISTLIVFLTLYTKQEKVAVPKVEIIKEVPKPVQVIVEQTIDVPIKPILSTSSEKIILSPSLDFIKKLRSNSRDTYKQQSFKNTNNEKFKREKHQETPKEIEAPQEIVEPEVKQKAIKISKRETQADIEHVIKRFKKNNNPALSLFIAK